MPPRLKRVFAPVLLFAIAAPSILLSDACRKPARTGPEHADEAMNSEPEQYSATVVRTVRDVASSETIVTRETRSGEQRREDWTERGQNRALILRPDLGKKYLLDLDRQIYVETTFDGGNESLGAGSESRERASADSTDHLFQAVDRAIDDAPSPDHVENRELPSTEIDGHSCRVFEQRATFIDGHTEITKIFRAGDLDGLALRTESYSDPETVMIITERKDIRTEVDSAAFTIPANFKRVDNLESLLPISKR